jgi:DNA polymerase IV
MTNSPNKDLIIELQVLLDEAKFGSDHNDKFRVKSYKSAIEKISLMNTKITKESDIPLTKGGKIYLKVKEFIEKGHIDKTREILSTNENIIDIYRDLQKIAEIGPVKAKDLVETHGIRSIDELKVRQDLLNDKQKIGLKYWETDLLRIPRNEIKKHEKIYQAAIKLTPSISDITISINGSYRRVAKDSGDIDILVTHPNNNMSTFRAFVDKLLEQTYLIDTLAYGEKKYMGYGKLFGDSAIPRRIDIIYCPPHEYPFAQLYFTGCGSFNVRMREYANSKGYRLNEKGLIDLKSNQLVSYTFLEEKDIFEYLGLNYVEPINRIESHVFH